jgi:dienelactone hydrolase
MLAELGHVALAPTCSAIAGRHAIWRRQPNWIGELRNEPEALRARGRAALATLAALPQVDASRLAAIGFARRFGGAGARARRCRSQSRRQFHGVLATKMPRLPAR